MIHTISYPVTLEGTPQDHKTAKTCFLVLQADVDLPDLDGDDVPVAMRAASASGDEEFRAFEGKLYRRTDFTSGDFGDRTRLDPFDPANPFFGKMLATAVERYDSAYLNYEPVSPKDFVDDEKITEYGRGEKGRAAVARLSRGFTVAPCDAADAAKARNEALSAVKRLIVVDGAVWTPCTELAYLAHPAAGDSKARVEIVHEGYVRDRTADDTQQNRGSWADPNARFFGASDREAAAAHAGVPLFDFPEIEVFDDSFLKVDFEKSELVRCAENVADEFGNSSKDLTIRIYLDRIRTCLKGEWIRDDPDETVAASLVKIAEHIGRGAVGERLAHAFDVDTINGFVARWNDRPIGLELETRQLRPVVEHKWNPPSWKPPGR